MDASETVGEDSRGYDGGKSRDGRKRHILTVTTADVHDSKTAPALLETFMDQPGRLLKLVWVDSAYQGPALAKAFARHGVRIEVVRRSDGQRGFVVLARRWVVERMLSRPEKRPGRLPRAQA
ncbi:transposase [Streptomyces sp. ME18-1-4]|uniref:transposase n=1 Tax=Streptomyces sp. ME18-1-4 TaxID=3028685 RepID=UPI0039F6A748